MERQEKKQDMGSGSIPKLMLSLAVPAVVAQLINMLYNIVDRIYIGHIPNAGASALTGVGLFLPILMMYTVSKALLPTLQKLEEAVRQREEEN